MRYFYDTEFVEDGTTIDLISIGIVADDGREYYAHLDSYDRAKADAHPFVSKQVLPYLDGMPQTPRTQVAAEIAEFIHPGPVELWGYFPSYDHVALAQLYGTMMDLPRHVPQRTNCIAQLAQMGRVRRLPSNDSAHDALADARWTRDTFHYILTSS